MSLGLTVYGPAIDRVKREQPQTVWIALPVIGCAHYAQGHNPAGVHAIVCQTGNVGRLHFLPRGIEGLGQDCKGVGIVGCAVKRHCSLPTSAGGMDLLLLATEADRAAKATKTRSAVEEAPGRLPLGMGRYFVLPLVVI